MKKPVAFAFFLWLLIADLVSAGDYKLVLGKGIEVCEAYLKNLNSFPKAPAMVCERPLNPDLRELRRPNWESLRVMDNLDLLGQVERHLRRMTQEQFEQQKEDWLATVKQRVTKHLLRMSLTKLDVDKDGLLEDVVLYENPVDCDAKNETTFAHPGGRAIFVLTSDGTQIDHKATELAFPTGGGRPDFFIYKGQVYQTTWAGNLGFKDGQIDVYTPVPLPGRRPCEYKYTDGYKRRQQ